MIIRIAEDFSPYPSGRVVADGPNSGERFRNELLVPALHANEIVEIFLDGVKGYPSSFTEEAFGGLIRNGFEKDQLLRKLKITYDSEAYMGYKDDIIFAIENA